jgi:NADH-quinone oxidoreductase subunit J
VIAESLLFYIVGALTIVTALGMVSSRNPVHAALWMVSNFGLTAILYLVLHAPFLAAVQVIVYAGAIMVLFLFVVMLLGASAVPSREPIVGHRPLAVAGLVALGGLLLWAVTRGASSALLPPELPEGFGSPADVGQALFSHWVLPFEWVSLMLLVALVGAVMIARFKRTKREGEEVGQ